jgi:hypothetical protein
MSVVAVVAGEVVPVVGLHKRSAACAIANDDGGSARHGRPSRATRVSRPHVMCQPSHRDQRVPDFDARRLVRQHVKKQTFQDAALANKNPYFSQFPGRTLDQTALNEAQRMSVNGACRLTAALEAKVAAKCAGKAGAQRRSGLKPMSLPPSLRAPADKSLIRAMLAIRCQTAKGMCVRIPAA